MKTERGRERMRQTRTHTHTRARAHHEQISPLDNRRKRQSPYGFLITGMTSTFSQLGQFIPCVLCDTFHLMKDGVKGN